VWCGAGWPFSVGRRSGTIDAVVMAMQTVDNAQVRALVSVPDAIEGLREVFTEIGASSQPVFTCPPRLALGDGANLVMTARHEPTGTAVTKALSVELTRSPAIVGALSWMDPRRAEPLSIEAAAVTTLRTGAVAGLATDLMAPPDADRMALVGSGAQAPDQVRAVHAVRPLRELIIVSRDPDHAAALARTLETELHETRILVEESVSCAVAGRPIVTCATSSASPVVAAADLAPGVHVNGIGSFRPHMRELPADLLAAAAAVVVEQREAALEEAGEIIHAVQAGVLPAESVRELSEIIRTPVQRTGPTVFKSVGLGIHDWTIARLIAERLG
jgi:ornithine cyclodeaminase